MGFHLTFLHTMDYEEQFLLWLHTFTFLGFHFDALISIMLRAAKPL